MDQFKKEVLQIARSAMAGCDRSSFPFIFGGAVRDFVADVDYNDIDIHFGSENDLNRYLGKLRVGLEDKYGIGNVSAYDASLDADTSLYVDSSPNVKRTIYTITHEGKDVDIQFDFFTPSEDDDLDPSDMDISVNSLTMNCYGEIGALGGRTDVSITKAQILKREFVQCRKDVSAYRLNKVDAMVKNGWAHAVDYLKDEDKRNLPAGTKVWVVSKGCVLPGVLGQYSSVHQQYTINHISCGNRMNSYLPARDVIGKMIDNPVHKKETMATSKSAVEGVMDTIKSDGKKAVWRTFAKQIPKAARSGLLAFMKAKGAKKAWIKTASEMMDTEMGRAVVSLMLGWAIYAIPALRKDPRAAALAEEWRVEAMATVGDELIQEAMIHFGPVMSLMSEIPMPPTKVRVAGDEETKTEAIAEDTSEVEAETEAEEVAKKAARQVA